MSASAPHMIMSNFQHNHSKNLRLIASGFLFLGAALLIVLAGLPQRANFTGATIPDIGRVAPEIGSLAPPFYQPSLSDEPIALLDLRGESVIVNFWATWCVPCRIEMPELQALHEETGVRVVGANLGESRAVVARWVDQLGITFDIALDDWHLHVATDYRVRGYPSTFVIDSDGIITHIFYGPVTQQTLKNALNAH